MRKRATHTLNVYVKTYLRERGLFLRVEEVERIKTVSKMVSGQMIKNAMPVFHDDTLSATVASVTASEELQTWRLLYLS